MDGWGGQKCNIISLNEKARIRNYLAFGVAVMSCGFKKYTSEGNATIVTSEYLSFDSVKLTIKKDNGELVTINRKYDAHATVGARVHINEMNRLETIPRYEFK
ncbi:deoxyribose-phosphate aldolase [Glaesserella parasuis]|uniref:deoxyribose-phosphate aldolase n=1 Tax=Glaesserella parasuis TaxID=738 RepID=UPI0038557D5D